MIKFVVCQLGLLALVCWSLSDQATAKKTTTTTGSVLKSVHKQADPPAGNRAVERCDDNIKEPGPGFWGTPMFPGSDCKKYCAGGKGVCHMMDCYCVESLPPKKGDYVQKKSEQGPCVTDDLFQCSMAYNSTDPGEVTIYDEQKKKHVTLEVTFCLQSKAFEKYKKCFVFVTAEKKKF